MLAIWDWRWLGDGVNCRGIAAWSRACQKGSLMRYVMKQELFSFKDDFHIQDKDGQDRFLVVAKVLTLGNKLSFRDLAGNELCFIKQTGPSPVPEFELYKDDKLWARVEKEITFFHIVFDVAEWGPGAADLQIDGDFAAHQYKITRGLRHVADVSKKYFGLVDTYSVDIVDGEDDVLILALTVVIEMAAYHAAGLSVSIKFN